MGEGDIQSEIPVANAAGADKAEIGQVAPTPPEGKKPVEPDETPTGESGENQQPTETQAEKGPTKETLEKTKELLGEIRGDLEKLIKEGQLTQEAQESGVKKEDLEGEIAEIQAAIEGLEKENNPEKAKEYLLAKYQERLTLLKNAETILEDIPKTKEALIKTGAEDIADSLPEEEAADDKDDLEVKVEEKEEETKLKEETEAETKKIKEVLKELGVDSKKLQEIEELAKKKPEEQLDDLAQAQEELGKKDSAQKLQELQKKVAAAKDENERFRILIEELRRLIEELRRLGITEDVEEITAGVEEAEKKPTRLKIWQTAKHGVILSILLSMGVSQLEQLEKGEM